MFGLLRPKAPLTAREKAWVETRMLWLADSLGVERLLNAKIILPTAEYFPDEVHDACGSVRDLLRRVCGYLQVDPDSVQLAVRDEDPVAAAAHGPQGHAGCSSGCSTSRGEEDPELVVAALTHKLCSEILVRDGKLAAGHPELQQRAELYAIFSGMGVFVTNTATTRGGLPVRMSGYALSLFAWVRDETRPRWARHLGLDASSALRSGLRYLRRTRDSLFQTTTVRRRYGAHSVNELMLQLRTGTPSTKIAALWELAEKEAGAKEALPLVVDLLRTPNADIRAEAAQALGAMGSQAVEAVPRLTDLLHDRKDEVRSAAATALGTLRVESQSVVPELAHVLGDGNPVVVRSVGWALSQYGAEAEAAVPDVLLALRTAFVECHDQKAEHLVVALDAIVPDGTECILGYFDERDSDLRHVAQDFLQNRHEESVS